MGSAIAYFTPLTGIAGGFTIGLSAAVLLLLTGDILGASGLINALFLTPRQVTSDTDSAWKLAFLSSFGLFSSLVLGRFFAEDERLGRDASIPVLSTFGYLLAGFFVGFGTRLGNGCTTGHGICGMARLSLRSITAVVTFMMTALATATFTAPDNKAFAKGTAWLRTNNDAAPNFYNPVLGVGVTCVVVVLPTLVALWNYLYRHTPETGDRIIKCQSSYFTELQRQSGKVPSYTNGPCGTDVEKNGRSASTCASQTFHDNKPVANPNSPLINNNCAAEEPQKSRDNHWKLLSGSLSGLLLALGLAVSGMVQPAKVLGFLNLYLFAKGTYDPTLLTVMMSGCAVSFLAYQFVEGHTLFVKHNKYSRSKPLFTSQFSIPCHKSIDWQLLLGAVCFGIGWGTSGLCPGPAMFLAATGTKPVIFYYWPTFIAGSYVANVVKGK